MLDFKGFEDFEISSQHTLKTLGPYLKRLLGLGVISQKTLKTLGTELKKTIKTLVTLEETLATYEDFRDFGAISGNT